ncbi:TetR/AcrR family transcriptional regulator [Ruegeria sp. MALMAid1280]|uniref:TetR/AcrR family transcriptional regulator n=1 Tax=Ruegeria sp. MALMAid1280 TaxID=3411634 RepID=UPI003B9F6912
MATDTKTALLDVAEHAVRAREFDGFSYADLAEAVGIRKASIHCHFPTKATLSAALMDRYHATFDAECREIETSHDTGADRLKALILLYRNALNEGKTLGLCVTLISSRASLSDQVIEKIKDFRAKMAARIEAIFALGQADKSISGIANPASEARAALALLESAHLSARAEENVQTFDEAVEALNSRC